MHPDDLEKVADVFDLNQDGMIDHSEIMAVLKTAMTDAERLEYEVKYNISLDIACGN